MPVLLTSNAPHICKNDFDNEAVIFLKKYYPEALDKPMVVPILYVARHRMGLRVFERCLSEDFSILGQMCFTSGLTDIYDKQSDSYEAVKARYGTMILDPDTIDKRNEGCKNNTIAHEAFHWHKHRDFYIAVSVVDHRKSRLIQSRFGEFDETNKASWSDEDWLEWQAKGIAPRILMPPEQFDQVALRFINQQVTKLYLQNNSYEQYALISKIADFFCVSKQSALIRLKERGFLS